MFVNPCRVGLRILCSVREYEVRSESGGRQSSAMALSATVQQVRRTFHSSVQPQPRCLRTIYGLFMRASCWLISNSYEEATVTVARPVHEGANDCDYGFRVDRSQAIRFVSVLTSSVMPAGLAISVLRHSTPGSGLRYG